ncbi:hypothetical protein BASA81_012530 [Batrachochytrium salamandrivorans]|nr:hypothetical protein BASA81_012530 [Batrachochytrium salamandrivorans]
MRGAGGESLSQLGLTEPQALLISELASKLAKKPSAAASAAKAAKKPRTIKKPRVATLADQGSEGDDDNDGDYQDEDEEVAKPKRKASRKKPSSKTPRTMEGLGEALASAHEVGGNTDPLAQHFRKLTKANVKLQYEIAASEARYSAVMRGEFEIFQSAVGSTHRLGDGQQMECKLLIKYRKEGAKSFVTKRFKAWVRNC